MKNILNINNINSIVNRINSLSENSRRLWGKMSIQQMICHCTDQIKMAEGKTNIKFIGNIFLTKIVKHFILLGMPAPKGKVKTYRELDQFKGGTKPITFENDRKLLIDAIKNFDKEFPFDKKVVHPSFGEMNKAEWARLIYIHLDHHLRQFGC